MFDREQDKDPNHFKQFFGNASEGYSKKKKKNLKQIEEHQPILALRHVVSSNKHVTPQQARV